MIYVIRSDGRMHFHDLPPILHVGKYEDCIRIATELKYGYHEINTVSHDRTLCEIEAYEYEH